MKKRKITDGIIKEALYAANSTHPNFLLKRASLRAIATLEDKDYIFFRVDTTDPNCVVFECPKGTFEKLGINKPGQQNSRKTRK